MKRWLNDLCSLDGISGRETAVRDYIINELHQSQAPMDITVDSLGNILVHMHGKHSAAKTVLFDAHMDEVGIMLTHINDDGTLCFETVGGVEPAVLFGHRVRIGNTIGVIGGKAIHHCEADEKKTIPTTIYIDIGATSREDAEAMVSIGMWGTFDTTPYEFGDGYISGKAIDDRIGCALLLLLSQTQPEYDIWLSFSVQEEIGLRGAKVIGEHIRPDIAIIIDATTAADTVGSTAATCVCKVGQGAVVSYADRATMYDYELYQSIRAVAEELHIPTQTKNRVAGGNNAGGIQRSHTGVRVAAISLPCRYIHSSQCVGHWADIEAMKALLLQLVKRLTI